MKRAHKAAAQGLWPISSAGFAESWAERTASEENDAKTKNAQQNLFHLQTPSILYSLPVSVPGFLFGVETGLRKIVLKIRVRVAVEFRRLHLALVTLACSRARFSGPLRLGMITVVLSNEIEFVADVAAGAQACGSAIAPLLA